MLNDMRQDGSNLGFSEGLVYTRKEIYLGFDVGVSGGIRPNKRKKLVVLFFDVHPIKKITDYGRNIYQDRYDDNTGIFYYTGQGQKGDQSLLSRGNRWLDKSRFDDSIRLYLFRQHRPEGKHEFIGQVKVIDCKVQTQPDADGNNRNALIFLLKTLKPHDRKATEIYREIESEFEATYDQNYCKELLEMEISQLSEKIAEDGVVKKKRKEERSVDEFVRFKRIVIRLKCLYDIDCQVCSTKHFSKEIGVYSEVHHLTPWAVSHDDTRQNLVVICANCHRKFFTPIKK